MKLLAIDPGPTQSAFVLWNGTSILKYGKVENGDIGPLFESGLCLTDAVCERIRSYGMPAGAELFETCEWSGRFQERAFRQGINWHWMPRKDVKMHLCGSMKAKDANIRQALLDRFGGTSAVGKKSAPGPLYGISGDVWAALAVAITFWDRSIA